VKRAKLTRARVERSTTPDGRPVTTVYLPNGAALSFGFYLDNVLAIMMARIFTDSNP
jgi:hypothetical protein